MQRLAGVGVTGWTHERILTSDGRTLAAHTAGSGQPAVVFDAGHGCWSKEWQELGSELAGETRVVSFDRAGYGDSDRAPAVWNLEVILSDLGAVIGAAAGPRPVLVGHSLGGLYVRAWAMRHPEAVSGLVLVDPTHESQWETLPPLRRALTRTVMKVLMGRYGLFGVIDRVTRGKGGSVDEGATIESSLSAMRADTRTMPAIPVEVLAPAPKSASSHARVGLLESIGGRFTSVEGVGHFIHRQRPDVVKDAIRRLLAEARSGIP